MIEEIWEPHAHRVPLLSSHYPAGSPSRPLFFFPTKSTQLRHPSLRGKSVNSISNLYSASLVKTSPKQPSNFLPGKPSNIGQGSSPILSLVPLPLHHVTLLCTLFLRRIVTRHYIQEANTLTSCKCRYEVYHPKQQSMSLSLARASDHCLAERHCLMA